MTDPEQPPAPDDGTDPPTPDPGNSGPDAWTADLDDDQAEQAFGAVNLEVVQLPDFDPDAPDPGADEPEPDQPGAGA